MARETISVSEIDYDKILQYSKKMDSIFQHNADIKKTAYLNWRTGFVHESRKQFVVMGKAFFSSAFHLVEECLEDNSDKKSDSWIFPIMFNTVHGIEVYLKAINAVLSVVLSKKRGITDGGHDLKGLCSVAKKLLAEYKTINICDTTEQMYTAIKVIEKFIANIYEKTDDMTFARYPMDKNKNSHFYIQNLENEVIDLELLKEQLALVYHMLDFIYDMPELEIEINAEAMMYSY